MNSINPAKCPECKSTAIDCADGFVEAPGKDAKNPVFARHMCCMDCEADWYDMYVFESRVTK